MSTLVGLRIAPEAVERLNALARETRRGKGAVMTLLLLAAEATPEGGLRLRSGITHMAGSAAEERLEETAA
jgi:hypothetical protein